MARKKKTEEKKEDFKIEDELEKINLYLREGLEKYIFENNIVLKSKEEFEELLKKYGG